RTPRNRLPESNGQAHANGAAVAPFAPSTNGANGDRGARGRFTRGNKAARGHGSPGCANPFMRDLSRVRATLVRSLTNERMDEVVAALVAMVTRDHNLAAAESPFKHCVGPRLKFNAAPDGVDITELERLRSQGQTDSLGNSRLDPRVALIIERSYQTMASVATLAEDLAGG